MAAKLFRHLFYGSDSRRSLLELQRWVALYELKYGQVARYIIEADECDLTEVRQRLLGYLQGASLFDEPQLLVIKRLSQPRKPTAAQTKQIIQIAEECQRLPKEMTLLIWEEYELAIGHPLLEAWNQFQTEGSGKIHRFQVPDERSLAATISLQLKEYDLGVTSEAVTWIREQYRMLGLLQLPERGKTAGPDERGWWLANLLDGAALRARGNMVELVDVQSGEAEVRLNVAPFALTKALAAGNFQEAWYQARKFMQSADDRAYFPLWGALSWQLSQPGSRLLPDFLRTANQLLAEVEISAKLNDLAPAWILHQYLTKVEAGGGSLIEPRVLWLAGLPLL